MRLPKNLPADEVLREALTEYRQATTYWYAPKAHTLNDENVALCAEILHVIFEEFLGSPWTTETQDTLLARLTEEGVNAPRIQGGTLQDRTALVRINKVFLETLGLLWVQDDEELVITDAGLALLLSREDRGAQHELVEAQVAKLQYPNPLMSQRTARDGLNRWRVGRGAHRSACRAALWGPIRRSGGWPRLHVAPEALRRAIPDARLP